MNNIFKGLIAGFGAKKLGGGCLSTRLEVHLSDENGHKDALNDKRCVVEARLEGVKPIAVTNIANNHEQAVEGAIDKLKSTLETKFGRLNNH